jgi:hypothetical protein
MNQGLPIDEAISKANDLEREIRKLAAPVTLALKLAPNKTPFPGNRSEWNGFDRYDFEVDGKPVLVVVPKMATTGKPWVWEGEFFGHKPAPDVALLGKGFHVVYMSIPDMLGCPEAVDHWNVFYREIDFIFRTRRSPARRRRTPPADREEAGSCCSFCRPDQRAKGPPPSQPGPTAQVVVQTNPKGLKARPKV